MDGEARLSNSRIERIDQFHSTIMNSNRRIFIYIPPDYDTEIRRNYPVIYMHAGQRVFSSKDPHNESWDADIRIDKLIHSMALPPVIVVGVAHVRPETSNEFYHFWSPEERYGITSSGLQYERFLIEELKPYIDANYRTIISSEYTALVGSSAAGLCTYHIGLRRPDIFGNVAILSPYLYSMHSDGSVEQQLFREPGCLGPRKIWIDTGGYEGFFLPSYVRDLATRLHDKLSPTGTQVIFYQDPEGGHHEFWWGKRFELVVMFFFGREGRPISLRLEGRREIGLTGHTEQLNPIVELSNGIKYTPLDGIYCFSPKSILSIDQHDKLRPQGIGEAEIQYHYMGLKTSHRVRITPFVSSTVAVHMSVDGPNLIPDIESLNIGWGLFLHRTASNHYEGLFSFARDMAFDFKFSRGFRKFETTESGAPVTYRRFKASEDLSLTYKIRGWRQ